MPEEKVNILKSIADTIDDIWDSIIGGRPVSRLIEIAENIAPAKVARKLGLPAPGDLPDKVAQDLESAVKTGTIPKPPSPEEIRRKILGR